MLYGHIISTPGKVHTLPAAYLSLLVCLADASTTVVFSHSYSSFVDNSVDNTAFLVDNHVGNFFLWITLPVTLKDSVLVGVAVYGVAIEG